MDVIPPITVSNAKVPVYNGTVGYFYVFGEPSGTKVTPSMEVMKDVIKEYIRNRASEETVREFALDILEGVAEQRETGNSKRLSDDLESWCATAELELDEDAIRRIEVGHAEIQRGESVKWKPGRFTK